MAAYKPLKGFAARNHHIDDTSDMNISMEEESHCSESVTLSSPPRAVRERTNRSSGTSMGFASASRLFFGEFENDDDLESKKPPGILRPLDLNMQLSGVSDGTTASQSHAAANSRTPHRKPFSIETVPRKRHAEQQLIGRDLSFDDAEDSHQQQSPVEMMQSPRISPSCYKSPGAHRTAAATIHKSPCFRTLDGRTVQSKNPFSPMYTEDITVANGTGPLSEALNFPVALEDRSGHHSANSQGAPFLRHRLQKRDTRLNHVLEQPVKTSTNYYDSFTRDGYPERKGRYSYTGSPIHEMAAGHARQGEDSSTAMQVSHKVRRRTKFEDAAAAASVAPHPTMTNYYRNKQQHSNLFVDTQPQEDVKSYYRQRDKISPTDVFSFPALTSPDSPSTPVPPTPTKPKHYSRRPKTRYTPVRKQTVPPTPIPERRARAAYNHSNEDTMEHERKESKPQSRFYCDFDVIDELGNGSFGNVFKVMSRLDGCMYAIKVAHRPAKGNADKDRMLKEVSTVAGSIAPCLFGWLGL